ncbi:MAG: hypothetical protein WA919_12430 [Coleofasciculaceae cyanobacterium]
MNIFAVLDVAIGLLLIYLVLGLLASEIQELIATVLEWRAKHLRESIVNLLQGELTEELYKTPLLKSLNQKRSQQAKSVGPSYIPSEVFSTALLEILKDKSLIDKYKFDVGALETLEEFIGNVENSQLSEELKYNLTALARKAKSKAQNTKEQVQQLEREIANWFDSSMARVSGVYTRNAKGVALLIGLVIALAANADTVYIVKSLANEQTIRSTVTQVADQIVAPNSEALSCLNAAENKEQALKCTTDIRDEVNLILNDISPLPIGWNLSEPFKKQFGIFNFQSLGEALIGWILSGVAIAMGAPFWFEILSKVINVRNAGKKP